MHVYKKSITHNPQDHPLQRYADLRITLVSVLIRKGGGRGGGTYLILWPWGWALIWERAFIREWAMN